MQPKPIRSFVRGLAVLAALNRHGSASALTLARETGVPRATVYRLLQTLLEEGYVGRGTADERFHLRLKVRGLSGGFEDEQWIAAIAGPALVDLTRRISWPCDVTTLQGLKMVIRDTTHPIAPLSIDRNMVGEGNYSPPHFSSWWDHDGFSRQGIGYRLERGQAVQAAGGDDRGGGGIDLRPPFRPEASRDFAEDHGRTQSALAGIVGVGHVAARDETEQVIAIAAHGLEQTA
jgi:IclR helix-turn-helix domain